MSLESHNIIQKGIDRNNRYTSKPVDDFINTMKQRISGLNPNNVEDAKQIMRLKNSMDVAQHYGEGAERRRIEQDAVLIELATTEIIADKSYQRISRALSGQRHREADAAGYAAGRLLLIRYFETSGAGVLRNHCL